MKKYYVTKDTKLVVSHELSVSNKIVEKAPVLEVLNIVKKWVKQLFPDKHYVVYYKGDKPDIDMITMYDPSTVGDNIELNVYHTPHNVRFQIGTFETTYKINESSL